MFINDKFNLKNGPSNDSNLWEKTKIGNTNRFKFNNITSKYL